MLFQYLDHAPFIMPDEAISILPNISVVSDQSLLF
jgi:hypothetical protein